MTERTTGNSSETPNGSIDLDALEALLAKATPGPWEVAPNIATPRGDGVRSIEGPRLRGDGRTVSTIVADQSPTDDAHAIAALRNAAPQLLAIARAVKEWANTQVVTTPTDHGSLELWARYEDAHHALTRLAETIGSEISDANK